MRILKIVTVAVLVAILGLGPLIAPNASAQQGASSFGYGRRDAVDYNFTPARIFAGPVAAASPATFQLTNAQIKLADGRTIVPWFVGQHVKVGTGSQQETVTLTGVSGCFNGAPQGNCTITGNTTNAHGQGDLVASSTLGAEEAVYDAWVNSGSLVTVGPAWVSLGGTPTMLGTVQPFYGVTIEDVTQGPPVYWTVQDGLTPLAAPTTLTAVTALPSATPVGAFGTGTYHMCIAYVDILGQEGPCSADFSQAGLATGSFIFSAPAASTGAVGYTIYIGLTGGGVTNLDYKVPLVTQPTVVGAFPLANGVCTLTTLERTTPACAVTNTTYGQTGATATVSVITLNTSPIQPIATTISTTSVYVPNPGGRTTANYTPSNHVGSFGMPAAFLPFPLSAAAATVVPAVLGTVNLPPGIMNFVGRTLEVCGYATATATAATIENIQMQWDAMGQNTAGKGVPISSMTATTTLATTGHISFCQDFQTTVSAATATGGSINPLSGFMNVAGVDLAATVSGGGNTLTGAVGSLNLAEDARINVIWLHTTATDGAGLILQGLSFRVK